MSDDGASSSESDAPFPQTPRAPAGAGLARGFRIATAALSLGLLGLFFLPWISLGALEKSGWRVNQSGLQIATGGYTLQTRAGSEGISEGGAERAISASLWMLESAAGNGRTDEEEPGSEAAMEVVNRDPTWWHAPQPALFVLPVALLAATLLYMGTFLGTRRPAVLSLAAGGCLGVALVVFAFALMSGVGVERPLRERVIALGVGSEIHVQAVQSALGLEKHSPLRFMLLGLCTTVAFAAVTVLASLRGIRPPSFRARHRIRKKPRVPRGREREVDR